MNQTPQPKKWEEEFLKRFQPIPEKQNLYPIDYQCILDDQIDFIHQLLFFSIESCIPEEKTNYLEGSQSIEESIVRTQQATGFNIAISEMKKRAKELI